MASTRNTTHEWRCTRCGVTLKGRANEHGEIRATNAAPSGERREAVCADCSTRNETPRFINGYADFTPRPAETPAALDLDNGATRMAREVRAAFGARNV